MGSVGAAAWLLDDMLALAAERIGMQVGAVGGGGHTPRGRGRRRALELCVVAALVLLVVVAVGADDGAIDKGIAPAGAAPAPLSGSSPAPQPRHAAAQAIRRRRSVQSCRSGSP